MIGIANGIFFSKKTVNLNGNPCNLVTTIISDTQINLSWDIGSTNHEGHYIYFSSDGENYSNIDTVTGLANTYIAEIPSNIRCYFYVTAFKGTKESEKSNIENIIIAPIILEINISENGESYTLPIEYESTCNFKVDYGDLSPLLNVTSYDDNNATHTYSASGTYRISITGLFERIFSPGNQQIRKVISWGSSGLKKIDFSYSTLNYIPNDTHGNFKLITSFNNSFAGSLLIIIPSYLFDGCFNALSFNDCFYNMPLLEEIGDGIFRNCSNAIDFYDCCSTCPLLSIIGNGIFEGCTGDADISGCFQQTGIFTIPYDLLTPLINAYSAGFVFNNCPNLISTPANLCSSLTKVVDFSGFLSGCSSLVIVGEGLFEGCESGINFSYIFMDDINLESIGNHPFKGCISAENYEGCFINCNKLQVSPYVFYDEGEQSTIFLNKSPNFIVCFSRYSFNGTQGKAPNLWECNYGTGTPTIYGCFIGNDALSLSNYSNIPAEWKT